MHQVQLPDQVYEQGKLQAVKAGYKSVDEYVADVLTSNDEADSDEDLSHRFTPKVVAGLLAINADVKAGGTAYTLDEVREQVAQVRAEWLKNHPQ